MVAIDALAFLAFVIALLCAVIHLAARELAASRLRKSHTDVWERLGGPGLLRNSISNQSNAARYYRSGRYKELNDRILDRWIAIGRISGITFGLSLSIVVIIKLLLAHR